MERITVLILWGIVSLGGLLIAARRLSMAMEDDRARQAEKLNSGRELVAKMFIRNARVQVVKQAAYLCLALYILADKPAWAPGPATVLSVVLFGVSLMVSYNVHLEIRLRDQLRAVLLARRRSDIRHGPDSAESNQITTL